MTSIPVALLLAASSPGLLLSLSFALLPALTLPAAASCNDNPGPGTLTPSDNGLMVAAQGGAGCNGRGAGAFQSGESGGTGGTAPSISLDLPASSYASSSPVVELIAIGGLGGTGSTGGGGDLSSSGGNGGDGGNAGQITLTLESGAGVTGTGSSAILVGSTGGLGGESGRGGKHQGVGGIGGIGAGTTLTISGAVSGGLTSVTSAGGAGGVGHNYDSGAPFWGDAAYGGAGGQGGTVSFTLNGSTEGVTLQSLGGMGGNGGDAGTHGEKIGHGGYAGEGGNGGAVTVVLNGSAAMSGGLLAGSFGGAGGLGGTADTGAAEDAGSGGNGGVGQAVSITVASGASLTSATGGIVAYSNGNLGGNGGNGDWHGGRAGAGGAGGQVFITTAGTIATTGTGNDGIYAQAVGGTGGSGGGASGLVFAKGGEGNAGGDGGTVQVSGLGGSIVTSGDLASGITVQSIGGGGGKGGDASVFSLDVAYAVGGNGGIGGVGWTAIVDNSSNGAANITTSGNLAPGIVAQSIGGGGGSAGSANGVGLDLFTLTIGGNGGSGAFSGDVTVSNAGIISTAGQYSHGIVAQSIGGGGGAGGSAVSGSASVGLTASVAVGGNGGTGGDAAQIGAGTFDQNGNWTLISYGVTNSNQIQTTGPDSYGIKAQAIGGGGGEGGSALAKAVAFGVDAGEVEIPALTLSLSMGGSGGAGGNGGSVYLDNQGLILTSGSGSAGIVAQSIGGGGGNGGDSSASSYAYAAGAPELSVSAAFGGSGGAAGAGGAVLVPGSTVALGAWVDNAGLIVTTGESAHGILAQSIGGGGGNGGAGDAAARLLPGGEDPTLSIALTLGGAGGSGNVGGETQVSNTGGIVTVGDGARAIYAQSIGGGGGNGGGGAATGAGPLKFVVNIGGNGGSGNDGASVLVSNSGAIVTYGADAQGILAQSIGGGGGTGGKAASTLGSGKNTGDGGNGSLSAGISSGFNVGATQNSGNGQIGDGQLQSDNDSGSVINIARSILGLGASSSGETTSDALNDMSVAGGDLDDGSSSESLSAHVAVGGAGGSGGGGGTVTVTNAAGGDIGTVGPMSEAIFAQSVGGGGGKGGAASASSTGGDIDVAQGVGGSGGASGAGGTVSVTNSGNLTTNGPLADGIVAQSIGGGGGIGGMAGSKTGLLSGIPVSIGGSGGANGSGGSVTVQNFGAIATASHRSIGIVAQSIAGGGGIVKTLSTDNYNNQGGGADTIGDSYGIGLNFGGSGGSGSSTDTGGTVSVALGTSTTPQGSITTAGRDAYGIVAQSIGGGGGLIVGGTPSGTSLFKGDTDSSAVQTGNGGTVGVDVWGTISTSGDGAYGIVAQSIGGGGGFGGDTAYSQTLTSFTQTPSVHNGSGGSVTVTVEAGASVVTAGTNATALFAQSIGGGGGQVTTDAGAVNGSAGGTGQGGPVTVNVYGKVQATGPWSNAVYVSSQGPSGSLGATVNVSAAGWVQSASDVGSEGAAVIFDSGTSNALNVSGHVMGPMAVATHNTSVDITNNGWIAGDIDTGGGLITNTGSGTIFTRNYVNANTITNPGTLWVGTTDGVFQNSQINATLNSTGAIVMDVDFVNLQNDSLTFNGATSLTGALIVNPITLQKGQTVTVMTGSDLTMSQFIVHDWGNYLFTYTGTQQGSTYTVTPGTANFLTPPGATLTSSEQAVASALQSHWDADQGSGLSESFASLSSISSASAYTAALDSLSGAFANVVGVSVQHASRNFVSHMNSCPVFQGDSLILREQDCAWAKAYGSSARLDSGTGVPGFSEQTQVYQIGGQREFAPGWFLGGSLAYQNTSFSGIDGVQDNISGNGAMAGIILKREWGNWLISGAIEAGFGTYDITRYLSFGNASDVATSSMDAYHGSLQSRISYEMPMQGFYLKPYLDLQVTYLRTSAYTEAGTTGLVLDVAAQSDFKFMAAPMLEAGTVVRLDGGIVLRPFLNGGVSFYSDNSWAADADFVGGDRGVTAFNADMVLPDVVGRIGAGLDVVGSDKLQFRVEYDGEFASDYQSHGGLLKAAVLF